MATSPALAELRALGQSDHGSSDHGIESLLSALHKALAERYAQGAAAEAALSCFSSPTPVLSLWCTAGELQEELNLEPQSCDALELDDVDSSLGHCPIRKRDLRVNLAQSRSPPQALSNDLCLSLLPKAEAQARLAPHTSPSDNLSQLAPPAAGLLGQCVRLNASNSARCEPVVCQESTEGNAAQFFDPAAAARLPSLDLLDTPTASPRTLPLDPKRTFDTHLSREGCPGASSAAMQPEVEACRSEQAEERRTWQEEGNGLPEQMGPQEQLLKWRQQFQQLLLHFLVLLLTQTREGHAFLSKLNLANHKHTKTQGQRRGYQHANATPPPAATQWPSHINLRDLIATVLRAFLFQSAAASRCAKAAGGSAEEQERVSAAKAQHELQQLRQIQNLMWDLHCVQTQAMPWADQPPPNAPAASECSQAHQGKWKARQKRTREIEETEVESVPRGARASSSHKRPRPLMLDLNCLP